MLTHIGNFLSRGSDYVAKHATTALPQLLDDDGNDIKFRHLIYNLLAFSSRIEQVRNGLGELMGLTGTQYSVLIAIRMLKGEERNTGVVDIADYLHVTGAFVTSEVNKLVKLGLVAKVPDSADRRRVSLSITAAGEDRLEALLEHQVPVNDILFAGISREEFDLLCSVFARLVEQGESAAVEIEYRTKRAGKGSQAG